MSSFWAVTGTHLNGLAYAATGYKRVLEENRKLYNLVQDLKGNFTEQNDLCQSNLKDLESVPFSPFICVKTPHLVILRKHTGVLSG